MRIAQVAPLIEPVPPPGYGGAERVISVHTEELVRRGHDVTLFATGDSRTAAELVPSCETGLRLTLADETPDQHQALQLAHQLALIGDVCRRAGEFDVIHSHLDSLAFPWLTGCHTPVVSTAHGRLDLPEIQRVYRSFPSVPLVSISRSQRSFLPAAQLGRHRL